MPFFPTEQLEDRTVLTAGPLADGVPFLLSISGGNALVESMPNQNRPAEFKPAEFSPAEIKPAEFKPADFVDAAFDDDLETAELFDYPGEYAQRFDGVDNGPSDSPTGVGSPNVTVNSGPLAFVH